MSEDNKKVNFCKDCIYYEISPISKMAQDGSDGYGGILVLSQGPSLWEIGECNYPLLPKCVHKHSVSADDDRDCLTFTRKKDEALINS